MSTNSAITPASTALCERVLCVKKKYRLTFDVIATEACMSRSTVINQINGHFNLDIRVILAVAKLCPDVSAEFLLRGIGDVQNSTNDNARLALLESRVEYLECAIARIASTYKQ